MNYQETIQYLYDSAPMFQQVGSSAYKEGLSNTHALDAHLGHPHHQFRTIHVGGTNGKGSCSHTLAAVLQSAGYKVGLYTSPHLIDFRERIKVNGEMIPEQYVVDFVATNRNFFEPLSPSFFELTTALAFRYFADAGVDVAIIEVGLGGRLDCTNIIAPALSIITNISLDHTQFLGKTLAAIAQEKAGIIKPQTPVIIGESHTETRPVFEKTALAQKAPIVFAEDKPIVKQVVRDAQTGVLHYDTTLFGEIVGELRGNYQIKNTNTILWAIAQLLEAGFSIPTDAIRKGFSEVCSLTGLMGRWQIIEHHPLTICDTGHNIGGITELVQQLQTLPCERLHIIIGMVNDKDIGGVLSLLPPTATYYFTQASVARALPSRELAEIAQSYHLYGKTYNTVAEAYETALSVAGEKDALFIGGSTFIVADLLKFKEEGRRK